MNSQPALLPKPDSGTVAASSPSPPIVELARFLAHLFTVSYRFFSQTTLTLVLSIFAPLTLIYSPISYLLAPVFVFLRVLLDLFIFTPYAIAASIARNVYPIYVFVGTALLCAICVGLVARAISSSIQHVLFAPPEQPVSPNEAKSEKSSLKTSAPKPRVKKRVSIKKERDGY
ncbi:uncharacterized protein BXZ73DRAFT_38500 [Epithele typhae]|uniref:uncharacterized protein n=1 Tax=Epithele typhae TaxID=378194 RepID=UPI002007943C|nr:uncharacterized protein BXZ73DRAFT_38500 [Epithele typhae]KAH9945231.1 hypothetical protein BXZ73DRAFT_38500 [Epithele typhae]